MSNNLSLKDKDPSRKQPINLKFIFIVFFLSYLVTLAYSCRDVLSLSENIDKVSVKIEAADEILPSISVYRVTPAGLAGELKRDGRIWKSPRLGYFKKVWISLPKDKIKDIKEIQIAIGSRAYKFSANDLSSFKFVNEPVILKNSVNDVSIIEAPGFVKGKTSLLPDFVFKGAINWGGDLAFLALIIKKTVISFLLLLFLFILISLNLPKIFYICLIFLLFLIGVGFFSVTQVDPHHDGIMLKPAIDAINGKMLFRDTFLQYGALTTLMQALAMKIFSQHLIVIRLEAALIYGLISILLWLIYSRIMPKGFNAFACIIWFLLGYFFINHPYMFILPSATVFAVFSILLSLYLLILFLEKQKHFLLFLCGMVSSLVFWFKINYGTISFLSLFSLLIILNIRNKKDAVKQLLIFLLGYLCVASTFFIWLAVNGAINDFILQSVKLAFAFSNHNRFVTNDFIAIKIAKTLLRLGLDHMGVTVIWVILPIVGMIVLLGAFLNFIKKKNPSLTEKIILCVSYVSAWLWMGYYPINSLNHKYLSSVLAVGLFSYFFWRCAAEAPLKRPRVYFSIVIVLTVLFSILFYDINLKISSGLKKISQIRKYERIETPEFLRGIYVSRQDKQVYVEIEKLINKFPDKPLINLTNSGLYSLYKANNKEFHKMYMNWGWNNSYLYPDYIPELNKQILSKSGIILSGDNLIIEGYVPIRVFPELDKGGEFGQEVVFFVPGKPQNIFKISGIETQKNPDTPYRSQKDYYFIRLKPILDKPITVDSIIVKIFARYNIPKAIEKYEFDYNIMPRIFNRKDQEFVRQMYIFDDKTGRYSAIETKDKNAVDRLINIFSGIFLYEKYAYAADTFANSINEKIDIYLNKQPVNYKKDGSLDMKVSNNDIIDLNIPVAVSCKRYIIQLRVNYNGDYYYEETVKSI